MADAAIKFVQTAPVDFEQTIVHEKVSAIVVFAGKKYRRRELAESPFTVLAAKLFVYVIYETAVVAICLAIGVGAFKMICRGDTIRR